MGKTVHVGDRACFRQDSGEITARFADGTEKMTLAHSGTKGYRCLFYVLVVGGVSYLAYIFLNG